MPEEFQYDLDDGKYTLILSPMILTRGGIKMLRYGEPWPAGSKIAQETGFILALANALQLKTVELDMQKMTGGVYRGECGHIWMSREHDEDEGCPTCNEIEKLTKIIGDRDEIITTLSNNYNDRKRKLNIILQRLHASDTSTSIANRLRAILAASEDGEVH